MADWDTWDWRKIEAVLVGDVAAAGYTHVNQRGAADPQLFLDLATTMTDIDVMLNHNYDTLMQQHKALFSSNNKFTGEAADALDGLFGSIRQMVNGNRSPLEGGGNWIQSLNDAAFNLDWAIADIIKCNQWGADATRDRYLSLLDHYMRYEDGDPPPQPWFYNSNGEVIWTPSAYSDIDDQMTQWARHTMHLLADAYHLEGSNVSNRPPVTALPPVPPKPPGVEPPPGGADTPPPGGADIPPPGGADIPPPGGADTPPPGGADTPPPGGADIPPPSSLEGPPPPSGSDGSGLSAPPPPDLHVPPPPDSGPGPSLFDPATGKPPPGLPDPSGAGGGPPPLPIFPGVSGGSRGGGLSNLDRTSVPGLRSAFPFAGEAPAGLLAKSGIGGAGGLSRGGLVDEALHAPVVGGAGRAGNGSGIPFLPPMGTQGAGGANEKSERERATWLQEDRNIWAVARDVSPGVIRGGDPTAPDDGSQWDDSETPVYTPARPAPQPTTGRQQHTTR